jgi:cell division protein FtsL
LQNLTRLLLLFKVFKAKTKQQIQQTLKLPLFKNQWIVLTVLFSLTALSLIFFRMRQVEFDYQHDELAKKIEKAYQKEKALKAEKAQLLSVKNLSNIAKKFSFERPRENQVIVIPQENKE